MIFAQINTKGMVVPGSTEARGQVNCIFRLDKVLDIAAEGADRFVIRLQDFGQAGQSTLVIRARTVSGAEPTNISTDMVAKINENLFEILETASASSYTSPAIDITDTILLGVVNDNGDSYYIFDVLVQSISASIA